MKEPPTFLPEAKLFNTYHIHANYGGLFISHVRAGDMVSKGDVIGMIKNLFGVVLGEIIAPTDGIMVMVTSPAIFEDDAVFEIGHNIRTIR